MSLTPLFENLGNTLEPTSAQSSWAWATVTDTSPLSIKLDNSPDALAATPDTLVAGLSVNDRVFVQVWGTRLIVLGKAQ